MKKLLNTFGKLFNRHSAFLESLSEVSFVILLGVAFAVFIIINCAIHDYC